jgi:hypothetical protein
MGARHGISRRHMLSMSAAAGSRAPGISVLARRPRPASRSSGGLIQPSER